MSFTCGFFNSLNHDRKYNAAQMSSMFDGIIRDGIFKSIGTCMMVKANSSMTVTVGEGRAWFNHTWSLNDAELPVTLEDSELVLDRIDAVVLDIDARDSVRNNSIMVLKGTPSSTPSKPSLVNTADHHQYALAYVYVKAGVTKITAADITNKVGTGDCPFAMSIVDSVNSDYAQSDHTQRDYIKNRPCYKDTVTITWDGNLDNPRVETSEDNDTAGRFLLISGAPKDGSQLIGATFQLYIDGVVSDHEITHCVTYDEYDELYKQDSTLPGVDALVISDYGAVMDANMLYVVMINQYNTFIMFYYDPVSDGLYVNFLYGEDKTTLSEYVPSFNATVVKKLDAELLPDPAVPVSITIEDAASEVIIRKALSDGNTRVDTISFDKNGYPTQINANGTVIPVTWTEV